MEHGSPKKVGKIQKKTLDLFLIVILLVFLFVIILLLCFFFFGSKTETTGSLKSAETIETLICSGNVKYPFFSYENDNREEMKINASFNDGNLRNISLVYRVFYDSNEDANKSANLNRVAMNNSFGLDKMPADSFNATYSLDGDMLQMSIYADRDTFGTLASKYFLLDGITNTKYTRSAIKRSYENKGLTCEIEN